MACHGSILSPTAHLDSRKQAPRPPISKSQPKVPKLGSERQVLDDGCATRRRNLAFRDLRLLVIVKGLCACVLFCSSRKIQCADRH